MLNNVFSELRHKELNIATHSGVTRTLEGFLPLFSPYKLRAFLFHLRQRYMRLSTDCAGSHIFEKVIGLFGKFLGDEAADADEELDDGDGEEAKEKIPSCVDTLLAVCDELTPELGALTTDNYSTHVVRTLLRVLAGLPPSEPKTEQEKDDAQSVAPKKVPKKLLEKAKEVIEAILLQLQDDKHQAQDIIFHRCACPTIQTILAVLKQLDPERMEALIAQMLMLDSKDSAATLKHVGKALRHPIASHFIEKALQLCSPETYVRIYSDFFRHNIVEYGKDASANYVVQQLIASARHHAQPKLIFEELMESPHNVKSLFNSGKASVMLKLVEAFTKFTDIPKKDKRALCTSIRDVFMVEGEQPAAVAEAEAEAAAGGKGAKKGATKESEKESGRVFDLKGLLEVKSAVRDAPIKPAFGKKKKSGKRAVSPFSPIGCRLVQSLMLFPFDCVDFLLNSFLALDTEYLLTMGLDSAASRVVEAYLDESCAAPVKHKLKLIRTMHGVYGKLAVDRCGSHIVEKCYKAADVNVKAMIADELVVDEKKLDAEKYGKAVLIKCKIGAYKMKKEAWTEKAASIDKKRKMFEDILNDQDDDLLPSVKAVELASPDQAEKVEKKTKKKEIGGFVVDKYGSAALKEELRRAAKRQKEEDEEEDDEEAKKKAKAKAGKRKQLDAVESQMMELLGYGGDDADSSSSKKRRRDDGDDDGDDGEETNQNKKGNQATTTKKKNQNKKPRREEKKEEDTSLGFIMDVISATRSNKRAETPKQKQQVKEAQEAKLNKKQQQQKKQPETSDKKTEKKQQTNSSPGNQKEKKKQQKEENDGWVGLLLL